MSDHKKQKINNKKKNWDRIRDFGATYRTKIRIISDVVPNVGMSGWEGHKEQQSISGSLADGSFTVDIRDQQRKYKELSWAMISFCAKEALKYHSFLWDACADLMQNQD